MFLGEALSHVKCARCEAAGEGSTDEARCMEDERTCEVGEETIEVADEEEVRMRSVRELRYIMEVFDVLLFGS